MMAELTAERAQEQRALPLQMDMTRLDQVMDAIRDAASHFGRLDILVNNAGVAPENLMHAIELALYYPSSEGNCWDDELLPSGD